MMIARIGRRFTKQLQQLLFTETAITLGLETYPSPLNSFTAKFKGVVWDYFYIQYNTEKAESRKNKKKYLHVICSVLIIYTCVLPSCGLQKLMNKIQIFSYIF